MQLFRTSPPRRPAGTVDRTEQDADSIYSQRTNGSVQSLDPERMPEIRPWMRAVTNLEEEGQQSHQPHLRSCTHSIPSSSESPHPHQRPVSTSSTITSFPASLTGFTIPDTCSLSPDSPYPSLSSGSTLVEPQAAQAHPLDGHNPSLRGERIEVYYPRGVTSSAGLKEAQDQWLPAIQRVLDYRFSNSSLLEEALESHGSGVTIVGNEPRAIPDGNLGLASVGKRSLELLLANQAYTFRLTREDMELKTKKVLHRMNFFEISKKTRIRDFIRPPLATRKRNYFRQLREDTFGFEDKTIIIAKAIKAIIGAVYIDGGQLAAERVAITLGLCFKIP